MKLTGIKDYTPAPEQWEEIHGDPVGRPARILVSDCTPGEEEAPSTEGVIAVDKKGNLHLNYGRFVDVYAAVNHCVYCNGVFYTPNGMMPNGLVRRDITSMLQEAGWTDALDKPTTSLFNTLKDKYFVESLPVDETVIPLANGDLHLGKGDRWEFRLGEMKQAPYRLSVSYVPTRGPMPKFEKWLRDVFEPEDVPVVQEIMGYCLVPSTAAQEAFFFVGDAEVGKSGFGTFLEGLLGNAFTTMETQQLVTERFQLSKVENKLVAYDDDLGSAALTETGTLKKLITADQMIPGERKYGDPYSFKSYCKVVASANFMLSSLYDDSDGFYRRLHPILVRQKDPNRKVIRNFYQQILSEEKEALLRWALDGLKRVIDNGWTIRWSKRSRDYWQGVREAGTHFGEFISDTLDIGNGTVTTYELKKLYERWCREQGITKASEHRLERWLANNAAKYGLTKANNVLRVGRRLRGYTGVGIKPEWNNSIELT